MTDPANPAPASGGLLPRAWALTSFDGYVLRLSDRPMGAEYETMGRKVVPLYARPVVVAGGAIDPDDERPISEFQDQARAALIEGLTALGVENAHRIDGGGCDSGDWRDFTLAEIRQAFVMLSDREYDAKQAALPAPPAQPAGVSAWIPCSERLPEPHTLCLVHEDGAIRCLLYNGRGEWGCLAVALDQYGGAMPGVRVRESGVYEPTHWMPLPPLPAAIAASKEGN